MDKRKLALAYFLSLPVACTGSVDDRNPTTTLTGGTGAGASAGTGTSAGPGSGGSGGTGNTGAAPGTGGAITGAGATAPTCELGVPATTQLPRLTVSEYDNTIRDLFGIQPGAGALLVPDASTNVDLRAWQAYQTAAQTVAGLVMADGTAKARAIPCTPTGDGSACARQLVTSLGQRAFRRPLSEPEVERFMKLYTNRATLTEKGSFDEAATLIIEGMLESPSFLLRVESAEVPEGNRLRLSSHEVASRLSYLIWSSMPDDTLFQAAVANTLGTPEQINTQARRMLADPKARAPVRAFHETYMNMSDLRWIDAGRDTKLFPGYNEDAYLASMREETKRFVEHVVFDKHGRFQDLFTTPVGFVNNVLAPSYGLSAASYTSDFVAVDLDPAKRSGLLTRIGFLTAQSLVDRTAPSRRGGFIMKNVLCGTLVADPADPTQAGHKGLPLPADGKTTREKVEIQKAPAECHACHVPFIDPLGFALESYDAIGAYRETENGAPINTAASAQIGKELKEIRGPVELSQAIASSPAAHSCYTKKWLQAAYRRALKTEDTCMVDTVAYRIAGGSYTVVDMIADLAQSPSFRYRVMETAP